ncbi:MAG: leucine-rich repeat protein [Treponema sp.]|nr:leucine-rich repeat protein [Treponema sp.]
MTRTRIRFLTVTLLAALLLAAGCGSDDEDDTPAAEYKVLGGRLVWCAESLEHLTVPDSASSIGNNAFNNCHALTSVVIPATVTKIGALAFSGVAVREVEYKDTMRAWDTLARASGIVSTLATITVTCTDGIWRAGMYDWEITDGMLTRYCGDAADVVIPKSVTAIGGGAFEGRADITGVTIQSGVTAIGDGAFRDCAKLTGIEIPSGVTVIGENAFDGCAGLTNIDIPASVTDIGTGALPAGTAVTYHGTKAQWESLAASAGLDGVTAFVIDGSGTLTGYCGSAADVTIPDGVKGIAGGVFAGHTELEHIIIPAGVTAIGSGAFDGSGVTEISYGGTVAEWGALVEAGGIAAEVADITVECSDGTWTPAHRHDWSAYTDGGDGTHRRTCAGCGRTESAPHAYDGAPYERGDGGHYQTCTAAGCNAHSPVEAHQYGDEACTDAEHSKTCSLCTYSMTAPHNWSGYTDDKDGNHSRTCTVVGFRAHSERVAHTIRYDKGNDSTHTKTCTANCGYSETEEHTWGSETCADTEHSKSCTLCTYSASKPHDWGAYSDDKDGSHHSRTCAIEGFKAHSETKAHEYGTGYTDNKDGKHYQTCSVCGGQSEAVAHDCKYKDNADGTHTTTCTKCAYSTTEEHRYKDDTCENCGCPKPTTVYVARSGTDDNSGLTASKAVKTLSKAIELFDAYGLEKIMVCTQYTLPSGESTLLDRAGKNHLTLVRYDGSSDVSDAFTGNLLSIDEGNVTITNVTLDGNKDNVTATGSLLYIEGLTTIVTLGNGATVCDNKTSAREGGGVYINTGTFKMVGGTVTGNEGTNSIYGAGVCIDDNGSFVMSGGKISGNSAYYAGGVYVEKGTFNMSGGEISGNVAKKGSGGGGVYVEDSGFFEMTGGKIINNEASYAGGVCVYKGTFEMSGGEISENNATSRSGGVCVLDGMFKMSGGEISGNTSENGGVFVRNSGFFEMTGGKIINNKATSQGGGVYVDYNATFTMSDGEITGNTAPSGNGVYTRSGGTFTQTGGTAQAD